MKTVVGAFVHHLLPGSLTGTERLKHCDWCNNDKPEPRGTQVGTRWKCADCYMRKRRSEISRDKHAARSAA